MIEKITDYSQYDRPPYLAEQFVGTNLSEALKGSDHQAEDLETAAYDVLTKIWIDTAEGAQLDLVGKHLDLPRQARDDASYRTLLKVKAEVNISSGQPEVLLKVSKTLYNATEAEIKFRYPAKVELWQDGDIGLYLFFDLADDEGDIIALGDGSDTLEVSLPDDIAEGLLTDILPAGVGLILTSTLVVDGGFELATEDGDIITVT